MCCFVFFFQQKTAYEMRISDWSSDVCSSDLVGGLDLDHAVEQVGMEVARNESGAEALDRVRSGLAARNDGRQGRLDRKDLEVRPMFLEELRDAGDVAAGADAGDQHVDRRILERSEEHTSELQSLMRISYAVFCLKKKKKTKHTN